MGRALGKEILQGRGLVLVQYGVGWMGAVVGAVVVAKVRVVEMGGGERGGRRRKDQEGASWYCFVVGTASNRYLHEAGTCCRAVQDTSGSVFSG